MILRRALFVTIGILALFSTPSFSQPCFAPELYGAVADGVTNDATPIANALADAVATRGYVCFSPRVYAVGSTSWAGFAVATKSNFALKGTATTIKLLAQPTQSDLNGDVSALLKITGSTDWSVSGIAFDLNGFNAIAVYGDSNNRVLIQGNRFTTSGGTNRGVKLTRGTDAKLVANHCDGVFNCFYLGHTDANYHETRFVVSGNTAQSLGGSDFVVGVMKDGAITNNSINGTYSGIALAGFGSYFSENVSVTGNIIRGASAHCIQIDNTSGAIAKAITITGNTCIGPTSDGVYLVGGINGFVVSGNTIKDSGQSGVHCESPCSNGVISNNLIDAVAGTPAQAGVYLNAQNTVTGITDVTVSGNTIRGYDNTGWGGIRLNRNSTGTGARISIVGNMLDLNYHGILGDSSATDWTSLVVVGNVSRGNTTQDLNWNYTDTIGLGTNILTTSTGVNNLAMTSQEASFRSGYNVVTYSASMTPDLTKGSRQEITITNGTAFTINAPNGAAVKGAPLSIILRNTSGGAHGTITWNATYKMGGALAAIATGKSKTVDFVWNGTNWVESFRSPADVTN
jgi:putative cofactor-binding repeat protein